MASRRKSRHAKLFRRDAEAIIEAALKLREALIGGSMHLMANGELYWLLHALDEELCKVMARVAEKEPEYRTAYLGLLPLPLDYGSEK
jgi:hypothetical protein